MSAISEWSTVAASNNAAAPDGFPENMKPSQVNDAARELMAAVRTQWEDKEWFDYGDTPTRTANDTFTVPGDQTANYTVNRPIRCTDSSTLYGYITGSTYTAVTTCTVSLDSGNLSASLSAVALGTDPSTKSIHPNSLRTVGVANGGTGATTASDARTNLGLGALATESGTWSTFTPTVTLNGAGTVPQFTTNTGYYSQVGKIVFVWVYLTGDGGNEGAGAGQLQVALPVAASANHALHAIPVGALSNSSASYVTFGTIAASASVMKLFYINGSSPIANLTGAETADTTRAISLHFFYHVD